MFIPPNGPRSIDPTPLAMNFRQLIAVATDVIEVFPFPSSPWLHQNGESSKREKRKSSVSLQAELADFL